MRRGWSHTVSPSPRGWGMYGPFFTSFVANRRKFDYFGISEGLEGHTVGVKAEA